MKRLIIMMAIALYSFTASQAQTASTPVTDTLTNTDTVDLASPVNYFNGNDGVFAVSVVAQKVSGTTSANCILQGTVDGTNWLNLHGTSVDTFALSNTSDAQVKNWYVSGIKVKRVRVRCLNGGTSVTAYKGYFIKK